MADNKGKEEELEQSFHRRLSFAQSKIAELSDIVGRLEHTQVVYIAHKNDTIDLKLANWINKYPERNTMNIMFLRESEGVYRFGQKRIYLKIEQGNKILVRVGGGFMGIEEFIHQYTPEEVERVARRTDVLTRFTNKLTAQSIAVNQSNDMRETSPIRSPQVARSPRKSSPRRSQVLRDN